MARQHFRIAGTRHVSNMSRATRSLTLHDSDTSSPPDYSLDLDDILHLPDLHWWDRGRTRHKTLKERPVSDVTESSCSSGGRRTPQSAQSGRVRDVVQSPPERTSVVVLGNDVRVKKQDVIIPLKSRDSSDPGPGTRSSQSVSLPTCSKLFQQFGSLTYASPPKSRDLPLQDTNTKELGAKATKSGNWTTTKAYPLKKQQTNIPTKTYISYTKHSQPKRLRSTSVSDFTYASEWFLIGT